MDWEVRESAPTWPGPVQSDTAREETCTWTGKLGNQIQLGLAGPVQSDTAREETCPWTWKLGNQHQPGLVLLRLTEKDRSRAHVHYRSLRREECQKSYVNRKINLFKRQSVLGGGGGGEGEVRARARERACVCVCVNYVNY